MTDNVEAPKNDDGKVRFDLLPPHCLEELAKVYMNGAGIEYPENSWRKGFRWTRIFSATQRHLWAIMKGEWLDPKTGLPHVIQAAWNCFTLYEMHRTNVGIDDRWETIKNRKDNHEKLSHCRTAGRKLQKD